MKSLTPLLSLLLAAALFAASCGSDDVVPVESSQSEPTAAPASQIDEDGTDAEENDETDADAEPDDDDEDGTDMTSDDERIETWIVGPSLVDCVGVGPQKCMLIKRSADGQSEYFYDSIEGFEHVAGTTSQITVAITDVENPPADASSLSYRLIEIVEQTTATAADQIAANEWQLLGFRDGDLFDRVPDDVAITIAFDGDRVSGSAGCNNYTGNFSIDGDQLSFAPLAATKKLCPPPVMEQEDRFLAVMSTVETAEVTFDGTLVLAPASGLALVFAPA